jgi:predicted ATPase/DNA-binding winged helix-turn-helix (wHTH) protein
MPAGPASTLAFGPFRLSPARKLLTDEAGEVQLGSRALELLMALVERAGEVVPKAALTARVWPDTVVEESSLRVHVASLRKVLRDGQGGARYVINAPGRGYSFVAPLRALPEDGAAIEWHMAPPEDVPLAGFLPSRRAPLIGRDEARSRVLQNLAQRRFVTLVGPGGVGKTALAIDLAGHVLDDYPDGIVFVDLALVDDALLAPAAIAAGLGISNRVSDSEPVLGAYLREKHLLLILDNCEHVSQVVGPLIQRQLAASPWLHVLATSREPLNAASETLHRLQGLDVPAAGAALSAAEAMKHHAVRLFVARASASSGAFRLKDEEAPLVADICRWLAGNPLAIELVAVRADLFGIAELAASLDSRLLRSRQARRTALPRHRTLAAMLDWSYELLSVSEQTVLRRLAVFRSSFTLDAARHVAAGADVVAGEVLEMILSLAAKSLVLSEVRADATRFELAGLTRAYAFEKFLEAGDHAETRERHARYMLGVLDESRAGWPTADKNRWMARYGVLLDDILSAIDFALSMPAHRDLAIDLLTLGLTVGVRFSRFADFESLTTRALGALQASPPDPARERRLRGILIYLLESQRGLGGRLAEELARSRLLDPSTGPTWVRIDAEILHYIRAWAAGEYTEMVSRSAHIGAVARACGDPVAAQVAMRVEAQACHFSGDHQRARLLCEKVLANSVQRGALESITGTTDFSISMRIVLARIHWLQGRADLAETVADDAIACARFDEPQSLCLALAFAACPIALWSGRLAKAREYAELLREQASAHTLGGLWQPWARALGELIDRRERGELAAASSQLLHSASQYGLLLVDHLFTVEQDLVAVQAFGIEREADASWCGPELQRLAGERLLQLGSGAGTQSAAEACFRSALELARRQNAIAWELRAATSLARLWQAQGRHAAAYRLLCGVCERIQHGQDTSDVRVAGQLLLALGEALRAV